MLQRHLTKSDKMLEISNVMINENEDACWRYIYTRMQLSSSLWNSLLAALRRPEMTLHTFKWQLKTYLFHSSHAYEQKEHPTSNTRRCCRIFHDSGTAYKTADLLNCFHQQVVNITSKLPAVDRSLQITVLILCFIYCNHCKHEKRILSSSTSNT